MASAFQNDFGESVCESTLFNLGNEKRLLGPEK